MLHYRGDDANSSADGDIGYFERLRYIYVQIAPLLRLPSQESVLTMEDDTPWRVAHLFSMESILVINVLGNSLRGHRG